MSGLKIAVNQDDMAVRLARAEAELAAERAKVDLLQRHLDDVRRMLPPPDAKASYSSHQVAFRRVMVEDDTSAHHQLSGITPHVAMQGAFFSVQKRASAPQQTLPPGRAVPLICQQLDRLIQ